MTIPRNAMCAIDSQVAGDPIDIKSRIVQFHAPENNYSPVTIDRAITNVSESSYIIPTSTTTTMMTRKVVSGGFGAVTRHFMSGLVIEMR